MTSRSHRSLIGLFTLLGLILAAAAPAAAGPNFLYERVQLDTNQLVYLPGDEFTFTMDALPVTGLSFTWFIYIQNNETGERRYYPDFNEGEMTDIFGNTEDFWIVESAGQNNTAMLGAGAFMGNTITPPANGIAPGVVDRGMYTLGIELRDWDAAAVLYSSRTQFVLVDQVETLSGDITMDTTLTNDNAYLLSNAVFVQSPATLTIEKGTVILGESATIGTLIVAQGAKIEAIGTNMSPIIMTSDQDLDLQGRGQWGGLILNGKAPINVGDTALGEGDTGVYGGSEPEDSSGTLRYIRVEFAGKEFSPENELNGIAFQGVGSGTTVDHIQVHHNQDDGMEFFGGTVNVKNIFLTGNRDDGFDWTDGWVGKAQFVVVQQVGDEADQGMEMDNNGESNDLLPRSSPSVYNFTLVGDADFDEGPESDDGMLVRAGTAGKFRNFIVINFKEYGINLDDASTVTQAELGNLSFDKGFVFNNGTGDPMTYANFDAEVAPFTDKLLVEDPMLVNPVNVKYPDLRPVLVLGSGAINPVYSSQNIEIPPDDGFFDTTVWYAGGIDPFADWTQGWTDTQIRD